jgi:hypothetical protein
MNPSLRPQLPFHTLLMTCGHEGRGEESPDEVGLGPSGRTNETEAFPSSTARPTRCN